ncbi:MAG: hypothetical protein ACQBVK_02075 [Candidatus Phytoplasma sp. TWB_XP]
MKLMDLIFVLVFVELSFIQRDEKQQKIVKGTYKENWYDKIPLSKKMVLYKCFYCISISRNIFRFSKY